MDNLRLKDKISASFKGALLPWLPSHSSGADSFIQILSLFGKQDPTPVKSAIDAYERYIGWIQAVVSLIAYDVRASKFHLYNTKGTDDRDKWEELKISDYPALLKPNSEMTIYDLLEYTQMSEDLTGEAFWHILRDSPTRPAYGIQFLRTEWVTDYEPNKEKTRIAGWKVQVSGQTVAQTIPREDIVHFKYPHPQDSVRGCSPLAAAAMSQDLDTFLRSYVTGFFKGGGIPPVAIESALPKLTSPQRRQILNIWREKFGGSSGEPAVMSRGSKIHNIGWPLKDLDIQALTKFSREEIFAIYGVPAFKFGIKETGGLSEDNQSFEFSYQHNCLRPRLYRNQEEINLFAIPAFFGAEPIRWEYENPVQEDQKIVREKADSMMDKGAITVNQYLAMLGEKPGGPECDVYLVPTDRIRIPKGELITWTDPADQAKQETKREQEKLFTLTQTIGTVRVQMAQLEFIRAQDPLERGFKSKLRSRFSAEQKMVLAAFDEEFKSADKPEAGFRYVGKSLNDRFEIEPAGLIKAYGFTGGILEETNINAWTETEVEAARAGLASGVTLSATEIGQEEVINSAQIARRANQLAGERVGLITNDTYKRINAITAQGLEEGWGTAKIRKAIQDTYDTWKGYRVDAIARTETANAVNTGKFWGAESISSEYSLELRKEWVATIDGNTRATHLQANTQKKKLDEPFVLSSGARLMHPGEYGGDGAETINCRCTVVFTVAK